MSLIILLIVVLIVAALAMWAVYYIPLPPGSPTFIKPMLYVVILLIAILVIISRSGVVNAQDRQPVPQLKRSTPTTQMAVPSEPRPMRTTYAQGFAGATRCVQTGDMVSCDNGYTRRVKPCLSC